MPLREEHPEKQLSGISDISDGTFTLISLEHPEKHDVPIDATESGIEMVTTRVLPKKSLLGSDERPDSITTLEDVQPERALELRYIHEGIYKVPIEPLNEQSGAMPLTCLPLYEDGIVYED